MPNDENGEAPDNPKPEITQVSNLLQLAFAEVDKGTEARLDELREKYANVERKVQQMRKTRGGRKR